GFLRAVNAFNPVAVAIEDLRLVLLVGTPPTWGNWALMLSIALACALTGHAFFSRCREEFADVL
ncbi:MAG: ABC transporter permease, partial [Candidatus Hydrogenedentes bacterium]|nr:ABC transporter permease [Candidatus Hydrogenedentota bacterium]